LGESNANQERGSNGWKSVLQQMILPKKKRIAKRREEKRRRAH